MLVGKRGRETVQQGSLQECTVMLVTTVGDWNSIPLGNSGQHCKCSSDFMPPQRWGSCGIYTPTPHQSHLRATPGGVHSSLLSPQEGKKMHLLTDGNPPWSTLQWWDPRDVSHLLRSHKGKSGQNTAEEKKARKIMGLLIAKPPTPGQHLPSMPAPRNHLRLVNVQIPGSHSPSVE